MGWEETGVQKNVFDFTVQQLQLSNTDISDDPGHPI